MSCRDVTNWDTMLESCTKALNLSWQAKRLFDHDGGEITLLEQIGDKHEIYVSCGEGFKGHATDKHTREVQARQRRRKKKLTAQLKMLPGQVRSVVRVFL